ncbi:hypothetical protein TNCT_430261 [Trichonephila clavata]|uniref:Uncharacterized protein n=1 Tax=Trichonephila clavata TaxID=2740835 RepID=A0A8X6F524_TRICU|nr:hypothetical protein TNCT_430261 [Trichonephila clavata]
MTVIPEPFSIRKMNLVSDLLLNISLQTHTDSPHSVWNGKEDALFRSRTKNERFMKDVFVFTTAVLLFAKTG